ncbi:GNAT family N-acetyltransferase [Cellulomonas sp. ATA003]|uniref:GNAT family N-acetyltransferase n=1 Tax=Cellulomonas sp. ATA003 TaxID=3073064 RepID=UPI00287345B2|nr:GNAT family N-acetyltransferase [Cellulomonas sp. ATA003]WNB84375.1 GNAT family N-acetyltransferase [Cellulomonas sp. ATA003]
MLPSSDVRELVDDALWSAHRDTAAEVLRDDERARSAMTGVADPEWNGVLRAVPDPDGDVDDLVHELLAPYVTTATPMLWHLGDDADPRLEPALLRAGLVLVEREPTMVADLELPLVPVPDAPVEIHPVTDLVGLRAWACVLLGVDPRADAVVPGPALPLLGALVAARAGVALPGGGRHAPHLVATSDGLPVGCVATFVSGPAAVVDHVVTARPWRGHGIGTALTCAALAAGRDAGHRRAVLTASPDGRELYRRLGFTEVGEVRRYRWTPGTRAPVG